MQVNKIRSTFLDFFKKEGHVISQSSSLVPSNDPTLLFTNAGMVPFKNFFTGLETPPFKTAASSQKCVRAGGKHNDLENVGYTARHHTFFEMLGNFSFGDYFKERAIELAWRLLTKEFAIDANKLYITIYHTDEEGYKIWKALTGFSDDKIIRIKTNDNFWAMGETGPCGPCSEIFFDHGDKIPGGLPGTPDEDGDRFIEIWNLVFMQFEDLLGGKRISLPHPSIDTGMGLERISAVLQGKHNNYEIDLFQNIINASQAISGNNTDIVSHRVIADHIRSSSFLIADGVMPSNEGRGYVLRRIMRRAMRHVHNLNYKESMLYKLVPTLITEMGEAYPELKRAEAVITSILETEEDKFKDTLDKGMKILDESLTTLKAGDTLEGKLAFKLYDTYGFPLDLTQDILRAKNIAVDIKGFEAEMLAQKTRAKAAWSGSGDKASDQIWFKLQNELGATEYLGDSQTEAQAKVLGIIQNGIEVKEASSGEAIIILNQTPFYSESGGQIGDTGFINKNEVIDTKKHAGIIAHYINLKESISIDDTVQVKIDDERRKRIRANHSATHLLHKVLREILGKHVSQKGSLVSMDRLRFDFSHPKALSKEEISAIEKGVNELIIENKPVNIAIKSADAAIAEGAMALFGEKYGDEVRVVSMGDSLELCGGSHVKATGDIGTFKIISEGAIASGVRRIEALTGIAAFEYLKEYENIIKDIAGIFKSNEKDVLDKVFKLITQNKGLEKSLSDLKLRNLPKPEAQEINGIKFVTQKLENVANSQLKTLIDTYKRDYRDKAVISISTVSEGRVSFMLSVSSDISDKLSAKELIKVVAEVIDGNGGGTPELAQAGGSNISKVDKAFEGVKRFISQVNNSIVKENYSGDSRLRG